MKRQSDWYDIDDILYDGTKEEIEKVVCPDCGEKIAYRYSDDVNSFEVSCKGCGHLSRANGSPKPNCVLYYGNVFDFNTNSN